MQNWELLYSLSADWLAMTYVFLQSDKPKLASWVRTGWALRRNDTCQPIHPVLPAGTVKFESLLAPEKGELTKFAFFAIMVQGREIMGYLLAVLGGYLLGASNMAFYLSKLKKVDMRSAGSGNLGTSNAAILLGWGSGIAVGAHDIGKAIAAVLLAKLLFPNLEFVGAAAGVACVLGHIFPFYLSFKGGKGFAPYIGMTVALNWKLALVVLILVLLITLITDYLVLGTFTTIALVPVWEGIETMNWVAPLILLIASGVILYKHRENITRLRNGTEIGLRSTAKGEHKVK